MSFAQPRNGNGIAEMMLLTVHGEAQVQTHAPPWDFNLFGIIFFWSEIGEEGSLVGYSISIN